MNKTLSLFFIFLTFLLLISPALAEEDTRIAVQFQDLGIVTQDFVVFDDAGDDVIHSNTSSTIHLDLNESRFYTIQLQPSVANVEPETLYESILNFVLKNYIALFLLIGLIFALTRRK